MREISSLYGIDSGFSGCIERLIINDDDYDMRKEPLGFSIAGIDVGKSPAIDTLVPCIFGLSPSALARILKLSCHFLKEWPIQNCLKIDSKMG